MVATRLLTNSTTFTAALYNFLGRQLVSSNITLVPLNCYWAKTASGALTLLLPAISTLRQGDWIEVADADFDAGTNNVTLSANGSDLISLYGSTASTQKLDVSGARATLIVNGANWSMLV